MDIESIGMTREQLVEASRTARENAYAPYSGHSVGAALLVSSDETPYTVFTGGNVENCNYTNTTHAEQAVIASAVGEGYTGSDFIMLSVSTEEEEGDAPCGLCQQSLAEFVPDEFPLVLDTGNGFRETTLGEAELFRIDL